MVALVIRQAPDPIPPILGKIKFHPGHYLASFNVNGTTNGRNAAEISQYRTAVLGGAPLVGYMTSYTWSAIETSFGVYNFANIIADFNALQTAVPGARFAIAINARSFGLSINAGDTVSGTIPGYILSNPGTYGSGTNGTQGGYTLATWNGSVYTEIAARTDRTAVMARYAAMLTALAATVLGAYTFNTHPLFEAVFTGEESSISVPPPTNAWSYTAYQPSLNSLYTSMVSSLTAVNCISQLNFTGTQSQALGFVQDCVNARMAMGGPDLFSSAHDNWCQQEFLGNHWNGSTFGPGGGTSFVGNGPSMPWVQEPDLKVSTGNTLASIYASGIQLGSSHFFWGYLNDSSGTYFADFDTQLVPFLKANPTTVNACPLAYAGACFGG